MFQKMCVYSAYFGFFDPGKVIIGGCILSQLPTIFRWKKIAALLPMHLADFYFPNKEFGTNSHRLRPDRLSLTGIPFYRLFNPPSVCHMGKYGTFRYFLPTK